MKCVGMGNFKGKINLKSISKKISTFNNQFADQRSKSLTLFKKTKKYPICIQKSHTL